MMFGFGFLGQHFSVQLRRQAASSCCAFNALLHAQVGFLQDFFDAFHIGISLSVLVRQPVLDALLRCQPGFLIHHGGKLVLADFSLGFCQVGLGGRPH